MRTATTIGLTHKGKWELISAPDVALSDQLKKFRQLRADRASDTYQRIQIQESDGHVIIAHLQTPDKAKVSQALRDKEIQSAKDAGKQDEKNKKANAKQVDADRAKQHADEIDQLNNLGDGNRKPAKTEAPKSGDAPVDDKGLRLDGPTPEEYVAAGYDIKNYPPQGYAAKPAKTE